MKFYYTTLTCLLLSFECWAQTSLPASIAIPGGVLVWPLQNTTPYAPVVTYAQHRVMTINYQQHWYAVVGIALTTKPGDYQLQIQASPQSVTTQTFKVKPQHYQTQYLTIKNQRLVSPPAQDLQRLAKEAALVQQVKRTWTEEVAEFPFSWPVKGRISSTFGLKRFYNQQPRAPHLGLDIAVPLNTPVKAPASGRVLIAYNFIFSGKTIYLDHGQGLITMYGHLNSIAVKPGQAVKAGEILGYVGKTGRATGPHLHWAAILNTCYVNPLLLLKS